MSRQTVHMDWQVLSDDSQWNRTESLPELVAGFHTYDDWNALSSGVLGVSAAELEAGWREYLDKQYAIAGS